MTRTRPVPAAVAALAAAALAVAGCSGKKEEYNSPEALPSVSRAATPENLPAEDPTEAISPESPDRSPTSAPASPDPPPAIATAPVSAPTREGNTKVYTFGDIDVRLTPNELGVYTAIHIPNPSRRSMSFTITVRVTGPHGYEVTMKRSFPGVLPDDVAREAGLLIDEDEAPVPDDPVPEIVVFEQTDA
ncbi:hypothetical protein ACFXKG_17130 [Streptomyces sp. NPDC059255]|uniref:hypothetical protein n=1 Tax=Streptomyces sp. NPDC059255 TaxID=3346793 RepID=UPI0036CEC890